MKRASRVMSRASDLLEAMRESHRNYYPHSTVSPKKQVMEERAERVSEDWIEIKPRFSDHYRTISKGRDRGQTRSESQYDIFVKGEKVKTVSTKKEARNFVKFVKAGGKISAYNLFRTDPNQYAKVHGSLKRERSDGY